MGKKICTLLRNDTPKHIHFGVFSIPNIHISAGSRILLAVKTLKCYLGHLFYISTVRMIFHEEM